jgi:hypothetical protein
MDYAVKMLGHQTRSCCFESDPAQVPTSTGAANQPTTRFFGAFGNVVFAKARAATAWRTQSAPNILETANNCTVWEIRQQCRPSACGHAHGASGAIVMINCKRIFALRKICTTSVKPFQRAAWKPVLNGTGLPGMDITQLLAFSVKKKKEQGV